MSGTCVSVDVSPARFAALVGDALDSIPDDIASKMENIAVVVDDFAPPGRLLGLYEGVPLTNRANYGQGSAGGGMIMPDRVTIFRRSICAICTTDQEVVDQVRLTVIHEVGHHFGLSDDRLHELGWA
ncbi:MAG TPA: metallopeptidase family protein [Acidimicrobiales bacterium]|nr:metallopeptidase family protein [Acidimicrobiales bacterium]